MLRLFCIFIAIVISPPSLATIESAITDGDRPKEDLISDAYRKPEQVLSFFEIDNGMTVLDLFSGTGYYTELLSRIVGPSGQVDAHNTRAHVKHIGEEKLKLRYKDRLGNVNQLLIEPNEFDLPTNQYDRILMMLSYHDLYFSDEKNEWPTIDVSRFMQNLYASLKENGVIGIVDHTAEVGMTTSSGQILHRIDPQLVKVQMADWGFSFIDEATFLHNPEDPLDIPIYSPLVKNQTHRSVLKFGK